MFRWFESLVDVFPLVELDTPPYCVWRFYAHYLRPLRRLFAATVVAGFLLALTEVAMFGFLARIVDLVAEGRSEDVTPYVAFTFLG